MRGSVFHSQRTKHNTKLLSFCQSDKRGTVFQWVLTWIYLSMSEVEYIFICSSLIFIYFCKLPLQVFYPFSIELLVFIFLQVFFCLLTTLALFCDIHCKHFLLVCHLYFNCLWCFVLLPYISIYQLFIYNLGFLIIIWNIFLNPDYRLIHPYCLILLVKFYFFHLLFSV